MIRRYITGLGLAAVIIALDLTTKRFAAINFAGNPTWVVGDFLGFTFVENPGAAFGTFRSGGTVIAVVALVVALVVLVAMGGERPRLEFLALAFIFGGAVGNLVDRVARGPGLVDGKVIDWINLGPIPTFNVADISVNVAVALILMHAWRTRST